MTDREAIRSAAARCRAEAGLPADEPVASAHLLERVRRQRNLRLKRFKPNPVRGPEVLGTLNAYGHMIHVAARLNEAEAAAVEAHEIGHHLLHPGVEVALKEQSTSDPRTPHGTWAAVGYSDRERLEAEADAFAAELLCPTPWLRAQLEVHGRRPSEVASDLSIPIGCVIDQAVGALLMGGTPTIVQGGIAHVPDARFNEGSSNVVIEAMPGAGATTMAAARVADLIGRGIAPGRILVLAPTEGMVDALRTRMASLDIRSGPTWTGTPVNLGFEVVTKNAGLLGRSDRFRLLDETGARTLFELGRALIAPHLPRSEAFRLAFDAKHRTISPEAWLAAATADLAAARNVLAKDRARKAVALAQVWAAYEERLAAADAIDEADLSAMPIRLLRTVPAALDAIRGRFQHIVVDGLHDFSVAGLELVRILSGPATTWAVGDPGRRLDGQATSRFQSLRGFADAIGAVTLKAEVDHVRRGGLARFVADASRSSKIAPPTFARDGTQLRWSRCATVREEACAIADEVERNRGRGVPRHRQVVLAHSHRVLKVVSRELARLGVPTNTLPDLWGEGVVGDLLAVAAWTHGPERSDFVRVATLPEYGLTEQDAIRAHARFRAPGRAPTRDLPADVRMPISRLLDDFRDVERNMSAAALLKTWLFERSGYLGRTFREPDAAIRQRKLDSIHHLLRIAEEHEAQQDREHARLLDRVRWAGGLRQSTAFGRAKPPGTEDTLRMMTINAARGTRFEAVHLAGVTSTGMGIKPHLTDLRPPSAFVHHWAAMSEPVEIETALFRVAVSRATQCLHVSGWPGEKLDR